MHDVAVRSSTTDNKILTLARIFYDFGIFFKYLCNNSDVIDLSPGQVVIRRILEWAAAEGIDADFLAAEAVGEFDGIVAAGAVTEEHDAAFGVVAVELFHVGEGLYFIYRIYKIRSGFEGRAVGSPRFWVGILGKL